jgi:putative redox protein
MKQSLTTTWKGNMQFDALVSGHHLMMDALPISGGEDSGPRPKELMLAALAGCTGMDVISILKKMRIEVESFDIEIVADITEEHPKHYTAMHIIYKLKGKNIDPEKVKKAVDLSQDQYCGVSEVYRKALALTYEIQISE